MGRATISARFATSSTFWRVCSVKACSVCALTAAFWAFCVATLAASVAVFALPVAVVQSATALLDTVSSSCALFNTFSVALLAASVAVLARLAASFAGR